MLFPQMRIARVQHPGLENGLEQIGGGCILGAASAASAKRPGTAPAELLSASLPTDKPAMLAYNCQVSTTILPARLKLGAEPRVYIALTQAVERPQQSVPIMHSKPNLGRQNILACSEPFQSTIIRGIPGEQQPVAQRRW
jgi:hypothetical protein